MSIIVFTGPSIQKVDASSYLKAKYFPPARMGDIYNAAQDGPKFIVLIDGVFENTPSVWHKEILWAIEQGITVFGCSSMGALRATELSAFGMIGHGVIYERYMNGTIDSDDEVAMTYLPEELNFQSLSEPLCNIRSTLIEAKKNNIISDNTYCKLLSFVTSVFYKKRTKDIIFNMEINDLSFKDEIENLREWWNENYINQKHLDAISLLKFVSKEYCFNNMKPQKNFSTEKTDMFEKMVRTAILNDNSVILSDDFEYYNEQKIDTIFAKYLSRLLFSIVGQEVSDEIIDQKVNDWICGNPSFENIPKKDLVAFAKSEYTYDQIKKSHFHKIIPYLQISKLIEEGRK